MALPKFLEGTGEELRRHLAQFPSDRFRLTPLPLPTDEDAAEEQLGDGSLLDLLGDYVGSVEGTGEDNAERHSERFKDYVQAKQREGRL